METIIANITSQALFLLACASVTSLLVERLGEGLVNWISFDNVYFKKVVIFILNLVLNLYFLVILNNLDWWSYGLSCLMVLGGSEVIHALLKDLKSNKEEITSYAEIESNENEVTRGKG